MNRFESVRTRLLLVALFFLPWQTRWIFGVSSFESGISEFGVLSFFAVEVLIVAVFLARPFVEHHCGFHASITLGWAMLLAMLISVFVASDRTLAMMAWLHVLAGYVLFLSLLNRYLKPKEALYAFALGLIVPSFLGLYQAVAGTSPASTFFGLASHDASIAGTSVIETFSSRYLRAYGSFEHPNIFGGYLAVGLFVVFLLPKWYRERKHHIISIFLGALFSVTLVLTYSRSAWLAFLLSFLITSWILFVYHRVELRRSLPLAFTVFLFIGLTITVFWNPVTTRFDSTARLETQSIQERIDGVDQWKGTVAGRYGQGVGLGNYSVALEETFPGREVYTYQPVHNVYLLIFGEVGLLGAFFLLLWVISMDRYNYAHMLRVGAVGALAMGNVLLVVGFFDHYLWSLWPGVALVAFVFAMTLRLSEEGVEKTY